MIAASCICCMAAGMLLHLLAPGCLRVAFEANEWLAYIMHAGTPVKVPAANGLIGQLQCCALSSPAAPVYASVPVCCNT